MSKHSSQSTARQHASRSAGPKGRFLIGHLAEFRADRLGFFMRCARTFGDVVPLRFGHRRLLLLSDPALIEDVFVTQARHFIKHFGLRMYKPVLGNGLVTSEGEFWRRQRKLAAPAFHPSRLADYAATMAAATERMLDAWEPDGTRDIHADMTAVTLEIACKTLFGVGAVADAGVVGRALNDSMEVIGGRMKRIIRAPFWFPSSANRRLWRSLRTLDEIVLRIIAQGRGAGDGDRPGLLSALLAAEDEDGSGMSRRQLLDEVRTLLIAGHETTALTLTYALYLLAQNPAEQARLQAEADEVLGDRAPAHADLPRLRYARQVVNEALRLYPPADVLGREAIVDCTIGGIPVRKGTTIFASTWVMHRDPRCFPDPERFEPGRWTEDFERKLPRFAYFPFGGGPRFCIGQSFAMTEAVMTLAAIARRFAFAPAPGFELELWPAITLRPRRGVRLIVMRRATRDERQPRRHGGPEQAPPATKPEIRNSKSETNQKQ
ncbi:MAG TPA: cytochrome P450 [Tepidisphaeraceae bacterium]|nr:cytochrome P450 [Tepidisphaeraceae bacterium]